MHRDSTPDLPYGFCHCGCGQRTAISVKTRVKSGYVVGEPKRFVRGHGGRIYSESSYIEQDRGYETPCWVWQGSMYPNGYGRYYIEGIERLTHRWMYEQLVGPIPDGLTLDHLCRVRACVNPAHLEPVTQRENILRGTGPSAIQSRQTHCIRGHEFTPENTHVYRGARGCRICGAMRKRESRRKEAA